jgi:5'-phosphate synthase pdxT subunit
LKKVGILAIQGDFEKHKEIVEQLGYIGYEVRNAGELSQTDALIIPGGESTTFIRLFYEFNLTEALKEYAATHAIFGTCAGCIVLASDVDRLPQPPLGIIDITVKRNAYGRQKESFIDDVVLEFPGKKSFRGVFIRAPKIINMGQKITILARHRNEPVMVASGNILVCTFHPELTTDHTIHRYFLDKFVR